MVTELGEGNEPREGKRERDADFWAYVLRLRGLSRGFLSFFFLKRHLA